MTIDTARAILCLAPERRADTALLGGKQSRVSPRDRTLDYLADVAVAQSAVASLRVPAERTRVMPSIGRTIATGSIRGWDKHITPRGWIVHARARDTRLTGWYGQRCLAIESLSDRSTKTGFARNEYPSSLISVFQVSPSWRASTQVSRLLRHIAALISAWADRMAELIRLTWFATVGLFGSRT
jgi:hypothetical protein